MRQRWGEGAGHDLETAGEGEGWGAGVARAQVLSRRSSHPSTGVHGFAHPPPLPWCLSTLGSIAAALNLTNRVFLSFHFMIRTHQRERGKDLELKRKNQELTIFNQNKSLQLSPPSSELSSEAGGFARNCPSSLIFQSLTTAQHISLSHIIAE